MKMKKKEILFFIIILLIAAAAWGIILYRQRSVDHGSIHITVGGMDYGTYSLGKDQIIDINGTNKCEIKDGKASMIEASCPDHVCMYFAPLDENGGFPIICLPNQVVIEGIPAEGSESLSIDSITG